MNEKNEYLIRKIKIWNYGVHKEIAYSDDGELKIWDKNQILILPAPAYEIYMDGLIRNGYNELRGIISGRQRT